MSVPPMVSWVSGLMLCLTTISVVNAEDKKVLTAEDAFEFFIHLDGTWKSQTVTVPVGTDREKGETRESEISYQTLANSTTVMGTYFKGSPMQMIDMIHQDGPDMVRLTHYCAVGNQPRMKFIPSEKPGVIQFAFDGGSNMDVEVDGHVHDTKLTIVNKNKFEVETRLWNAGKHAMTTYFSVTREDN